MLSQTLAIEEWTETHPKWPSLLSCIEAEGQLAWASFKADFHRSSHILVALTGGEIIGFLRLVIQPIGPDMDCPPLHYRGKALTEAKVLAFGVKSTHRGQGAGRALQEAALALARKMDCYQLRSHSGGGHQANHHLKLSMGFGVQPLIRGEDKKGVYFIMPLQLE